MGLREKRGWGVGGGVRSSRALGEAGGVRGWGGEEVEYMVIYDFSVVSIIID